MFNHNVTTLFIKVNNYIFIIYKNIDKFNLLCILSGHAQTYVGVLTKYIKSKKERKTEVK